MASPASILLLVALGGVTAAASIPYHTLSLASDSLPPRNLAAARPAPLKGFLTSPQWHTGGYENPQHLSDPDSTLEFYYVGLSDIMDGMSSFPGFDTEIEPRLQAPRPPEASTPYCASIWTIPAPTDRTCRTPRYS